MPRKSTTEHQTLADVAERLMATYEQVVPFATVSAIVCECRSQLLDVAHHSKLPMMVHHIASARLRSMAGQLEQAT
jgi:hypothetical protein